MMKQKVFVAMAVFAVVLVPASSAGAIAGFGDVPADRYFSEPVQWSVDNSVTGLDGACFAPDQVVTRVEAAQWIWQMEGQPAASAHSFNDVRTSGAVSWMVDRAITTGTSASTFSPDNPLTRAQLAAFLWRLEGKPEAPAHSFGDVHAGWQQGPVSWMLDRAITTGTSASTFSPDLRLTRAHLVTFLYRYKNEPAVTIDPDTSPCGPLKTVSVGNGHSCGLRTDNTVTCWGYNESGQTDAPSGTFNTVSAGWAKSCAIRTDNTVTCWGAGLDTPSGTFKTVSTGISHSCGLRTDNTVTCWGDNSFGQTDAPSGTFRTVAAGHVHSCGLRTDNTVICWGDNLSGQTDAPSGTFETIALGQHHSCGIQADNAEELNGGRITCWGLTGLDDVPSGRLKTVTAGDRHSCGIRSDNTVTCWGTSIFSEHGTDEYGRTHVPPGTFKTVTAGNRHSCGIRSDNTVICWGANDFGQTDAPSGTFKTVTAGWEHSCGIRTDNTATCWGAIGLWTDLLQ